MPVLNVQALIEERCEAIRRFHLDAGMKRAEVDVSGGVDSAVVLGLLVRALGPENVTAAFLGIHSNSHARKRAWECANTFQVRLIDVDLTPLYEGLLGTLHGDIGRAGYDVREIAARADVDPTIYGSIRSTLRAPVGRALNRLTGGGIRHGTGNECEDRWLRFYQKGGDGEVDCNCLAMLAKGEVYQLALGLGVPRSVVAARPSPDLWGVGDAHCDEDEILAYLGLAGCGHAAYSYVDPESGNYRNVGLIERVSRFCDVTWDVLFTSVGIADRWWHGDPSQFNGLRSDLVDDLLAAARRVERATRHKANPNCPTLGTRAKLVAIGALTNDLPIVSVAAVA